MTFPADVLKPVDTPFRKRVLHRRSGHSERPARVCRAHTVLADTMKRTCRAEDDLINRMCCGGAAVRNSAYTVQHNFNNSTSLYYVSLPSYRAAMLRLPNVEGVYHSDGSVCCTQRCCVNNYYVRAYMWPTPVARQWGDSTGKYRESRTSNPPLHLQATPGICPKPKINFGSATPAPPTPSPICTRPRVRTPRVLISTPLCSCKKWTRIC